jgi:hypothetical protein
VKILTVCEHGLNRSVTAKWMLQYRDHQVIAAGINNLSRATLSMLYDWADRVILLDKSLEARADVPPAKLTVWDVGADTYPHHFNAELLAKLRRLAAAEPEGFWTRATTAAPLPR